MNEFDKWLNTHTHTHDLKTAQIRATQHAWDRAIILAANCITKNDTTETTRQKILNLLSTVKP